MYTNTNFLKSKNDNLFHLGLNNSFRLFSLKKKKNYLANVALYLTIKKEEINKNKLHSKEYSFFLKIKIIFNFFFFLVSIAFLKKINLVRSDVHLLKRSFRFFLPKALSFFYQSTSTTFGKKQQKILGFFFES